jgi:hypothetical protein
MHHARVSEHAERAMQKAGGFTGHPGGIHGSRLHALVYGAGTSARVMHPTGRMTESGGVPPWKINLIDSPENG